MRHRFHRSKQRLPLQNSTETLCEQSIRSEGTFYFRPYDVTKLTLKRETPASLPPGVTWRPFIDWPGDKTILPPLVAIQRRTPARFCELRIPKLPWPMEFLLPMTRLSFPTSQSATSLEVVSPFPQRAKIVTNGVVIVHLIGARGLRAMPQVDLVAPACSLDDKLSIAPSDEAAASQIGDGSSVVGSATPSALCAAGPGGGSHKPISTSSPETRAASLVALHWAAKSLTVPPSPQVCLEYGSEKRESVVSLLTNSIILGMMYHLLEVQLVSTAGVSSAPAISRNPNFNIVIASCRR